MPNDVDTAAVAETSSQEVIGNGQEQSGDISGTSNATEETPKIDNSEVEKLRAELNKAQMRANQLQNEREAAERKRLEEANEYKTLYEQTQAQLQEREAAEEESRRVAEAKALRDSVIDSYENEAVKEAAKKLIAKNDSLFYWTGDVDSEEAAKAQMKAQLDDFAGVIPQPTAAPEPDVIVDANNGYETTKNSSEESLDAMKERLKNFTF